jgi:hypothetical protein
MLHPRALGPNPDQNARHEILEIMPGVRTAEGDSASFGERETLQMTTNPSKTDTEEVKDKPKKFMIYVGLGRLLKNPAVKSSSK